MTEWSAQWLQVGYERVVIGFDIRISRAKQALARVHWESFTSAGSIIPCSVSNTVWPRDESSLQKNRQTLGEDNGLNLLSTFSGNNYDGCLIAVDAPLGIIKDIRQTFGLQMLPIAELKFNIGDFQFLGFDIADLWTLDSALYSLTWREERRDRIRVALELYLSPQGLVDNENAAISLCRLFDDLTPDQAPFAPVGIWMHRPKAA